MKNKNFLITEENAKDYVKKIGNWIENQVKSSKTEGVVLGMSGGVDCSTVARLCQKAGIKVHLVIMPYGNGMKNSNTYTHAMDLINKFKFEYHIFDIKDTVDSITINTTTSIANTEMAKANIRPRIRMTYLYEYAQINNLLVIGTGNLSEATCGYFTKWGDGAHDINPLANITKREVYILAKELEVPESIITAKPSADLWLGQTDEEELGITYKQIDNYIINGTSGNTDIDKMIKEKNEKNMHKLKPIQVFNEEK